SAWPPSPASTSRSRCSRTRPTARSSSASSPRRCGGASSSGPSICACENRPIAEIADRTMVPGYRHVPGNHCGSTALRNLLAFHGVEISEQMAFGLGAGACFYYIVLDEHSPSRFSNGRAARLEENFLELTGVPLRLRTDA